MPICTGLVDLLLSVLLDEVYSRTAWYCGLGLGVIGFISWKDYNLGLECPFKVLSGLVQCLILQFERPLHVGWTALLHQELTVIGSSFSIFLNLGDLHCILHQCTDILSGFIVHQVLPRG